MLVAIAALSILGTEIWPVKPARAVSLSLKDDLSYVPTATGIMSPARNRFDKVFVNNHLEFGPRFTGGLRFNLLSNPTRSCRIPIEQFPHQ